MLSARGDGPVNIVLSDMVLNTDVISYLSNSISILPYYVEVVNMSLSTVIYGSADKNAAFTRSQDFLSYHPYYLLSDKSKYY